MTYAQLKTAVIEDTHRPDLAALVPRFIREAEDMIRREMVAYILTTTLSEADRSLSNPAQYALPANTLVIRRIALQGQLGGEIIRAALGASSIYVEAGDGLIEFRGTPPADAIFDLTYFGAPPRLVDDIDTNELLDENETLYKSGAMFYLYQNTQDRELASDALAVFRGVIETLNEQIARKIGGAKITASYQFGKGGGY